VAALAADGLGGWAAGDGLSHRTRSASEPGCRSPREIRFFSATLVSWIQPSAHAW
jgi:hypothetical protein